jgi:dTDP-4-amino-4,6-dideoxygalactose transaminase
MGCFSFHESKNIISGEGGALTLTGDEFTERAHIVWEKGTNRKQFLLGQVDKYSWVDVGSSFLPSEITAAVLRAQLEAVDRVIADRLSAWDKYHQALAPLEARGLLRRPIVPRHCGHNAHIYAVLLDDASTRDGLIAALRAQGVTAPFHYIPLHSAPAGQRYGRTAGPLPVTDRTSATLVRLPLWYGIGDQVFDVAEGISAYFAAGNRAAAMRRKS